MRRRLLVAGAVVTLCSGLFNLSIPFRSYMTRHVASAGTAPPPAPSPAGSAPSLSAAAVVDFIGRATPAHATVWLPHEAFVAHLDEPERSLCRASWCYYHLRPRRFRVGYPEPPRAGEGPSYVLQIERWPPSPVAGRRIAPSAESRFALIELDAPDSR